MRVNHTTELTRYVHANCSPSVVQLLEVLLCQLIDRQLGHSANRNQVLQAE